MDENYYFLPINGLAAPRETLGCLFNILSLSINRLNTASNRQTLGTHLQSWRDSRSLTQLSHFILQAQKGQAASWSSHS